MRRRDFIIGSGLTILPIASQAQQTTMPAIGFLSSRSSGESEAVAAAFRQGLADGGYIVGQNVSIEYRWAEGRYDRLPALAAELVSLHVAAILSAGGPPSALAAKKPQQPFQSFSQQPMIRSDSVWWRALAIPEAILPA